MPKYSDASACARADSHLARLNNGYFRSYIGTVPANCAASMGAAVLIHECRFSATAFPASSGHGSATSNALTITNGLVTGSPTFYRGYASDGVTCVEQWAASEATGITAITKDAPVTVAPIVHTEPA